MQRAAVVTHGRWTGPLQTKLCEGEEEREGGVIDERRGRGHRDVWPLRFPC